MLPTSSDVDLLGPWAWTLMGHGYWYREGKSAMGVPGKWAVIYDDYEPGGSIKMHVAVGDRKSVSRRAIQAVFEYPFYQLGVKKVLATVNSENADALSMDLRLGFEIEAVIEDAYKMGNMYILSMTQDQCRWLKGIQDGNCERSSAAA